MSLLSSEILCHVFSFFDSPVDLEHCANVNRLWNQVGNSNYIWREMAVKKYGEIVADTTVHLYSHSWKDLLHDDNRQGAYGVLNINKPCYWLANGQSNRYYCCIVVSLICDRRSLSEDDVGWLYLAIDARGESDLRHPIDSSIKSFASSDAVQYNYAIKWISTMEDPQLEGHYKGLLRYPIGSHHNLFQADFRGNLNFSYANRFHSGDYDSIKMVEGNLNSIVWDSYTTFAQVRKARESEEIDQRRWEGVFPSERRSLPRNFTLTRRNFS